MSKIQNVRLPDAATGDYSPQQFNQLVRSLEQIILQLNSSYTSIPDQNVSSSQMWFGEGQGVAEGTLFDYIDFNTNASFSSQTGRMGWDSSDSTLDIGMDYGVVLQVGQETYARVRNETGSQIDNGTVVGFAGASAGAISVSPYLADGASPSLYILGVMTHDLPDSGQTGYCTVWGFVRGLDTSAFSLGDILYASPSTAGGLTNVKPTAPDNVIPIAACVVSDATEGVIFVRPTIEQMQYYGEFSATSNQTVAVTNTAYAVTFDTTLITNGVTIGTPASRIVVPVSGLYEVSVDIQISSTNSSAKNLRCWFRKNGTNIANSTIIATSDINNGYLPVSHSLTVSLAEDDYIEVMYAGTDTALSLSAAAATAYAPAAAAVKLQITQAQQ